MSAAKNLLPEFEKSIQEATRIGFKKGLTAANKLYAPHAGKGLHDGNNAIMTTYKAIKKAIDQL